MKILPHTLCRFTSVLITTLIISCSPAHSPQEKQHGPATQALTKMLADNPEVKTLLIASIEQAAKINPDRNTNPVHNLDEYIDFVSYCETAMPWALIKKDHYSDIFDNTYQSLTCFYFIINQPLKALEGKGYYHNSLQYAPPFAHWLITFSKAWGKYLDAEDSWNSDYLRMAQQDQAFGLQNGWYEDPSNWHSFNDFFARYLQSPDKRPIAAPNDDAVVASFADSQPKGTWSIDSTSTIVNKNGVPVKSATIYSVAALLGDDSDYKNAFAGGTFTHSFLNVNDYHRYHFPMAGTVKEVRIIQGINPTGGQLWWDKDNQRYAFSAEAIGWQSVETRGCVILETKKYGLVALMPIGMVVVGSVNFEDNVQPGAKVQKGDMLGNFAFGGSDFIMLFQQKVKFVIDAPKEEDGNGYKHMLMGERLGHVELAK